MNFIYLYRPDAKVATNLYADLRNAVKFMPIYKKWEKFYTGFCCLYTYGDWYSCIFSFLKFACINNYSFPIKDINKDSVVIMHNNALAFIPSTILRKLQKKTNLALLLLDSCKTRPKCELNKHKFFGDNIFTFDPIDAAEYNYELSLEYYSTPVTPPYISMRNSAYIFVEQKKIA